jgi:apolipoprotein N-acyltransferase
MPAPMAALAVLLLGAAMGLYAGAMATAAWLRQRWTLPLPPPICWCSRPVGAVRMGARLAVHRLPVAVVGYAHNHSPLAGFAPVIGMYGLGWLAAVLAGAAVAAAPHARARGGLASPSAWPASA